jgi:hypothetical protein
MSVDTKRLVAKGIQHGWIKAPLSGDMDPPIKNEEARDRYLETWWRLREIELERLKLENEWLREEMLLLSFEREK